MSETNVLSDSGSASCGTTGGDVSYIHIHVYNNIIYAYDCTYDIFFLCNINIYGVYIYVCEIIALRQKYMHDVQNRKIGMVILL